jgi:hypothetical protein
VNRYAPGFSVAIKGCLYAGEYTGGPTMNAARREAQAFAASLADEPYAEVWIVRFSHAGSCRYLIEKVEDESAHVHAFRRALAAERFGIR